MTIQLDAIDRDGAGLLREAIFGCPNPASGDITDRKEVRETAERMVNGEQIFAPTFVPPSELTFRVLDAMLEMKLKRRFRGVVLDADTLYDSQTVEAEFYLVEGSDISRWFWNNLNEITDKLVEEVGDVVDSDQAISYALGPMEYWGRFVSWQLWFSDIHPDELECDWEEE